MDALNAEYYRHALIKRKHFNQKYLIKLSGGDLTIQWISDAMKGNSSHPHPKNVDLTIRHFAYKLFPLSLYQLGECGSTMFYDQFLHSFRARFAETWNKKSTTLAWWS